MPKKERFEWVDVAKGIGIIIVVAVGHSLRQEMRQDSPFCQQVYDAFSMFTLVMFYALSGFTYRMGRTAAFGRFLQKKVQTLLIPFFGYALFMYVVYAFVMWFPPTSGLLAGEGGLVGIGEYIRLTLLYESPYATHLWFIWALFWISLIVYLADRLSERFGLPRQWVLWAVAIGLQLLDTFFEIRIGCLHNVFTNVIGYVFGTELAAHPELMKKGNSVVTAAALLATGGIVGFGYQVLGRSMEPWYLDLLRLTAWYAVRLVLIWSLFRISERLKRMKWLTFLGRNSMYIYLLHQPFCCGLVGTVLYSKLGLPILPSWAGAFLAGLLLPLLAMKIWVWFGSRFLQKAH